MNGILDHFSHEEPVCHTRFLIPYHTVLSCYAACFSVSGYPLLHGFWLLFFFKDYFCVKKMHLLSSAAVSILYYRSSSYNYVEILNSLSSPFDFAL